MTETPTYRKKPRRSAYPGQRMVGRYMTAFCCLALLAALVLTAPDRPAPPVAATTKSQTASLLKATSPAKSRPVASPEPADYVTPLPSDLEDVLVSACEVNGVPVSLALGVMYTESRFQPGADSGVAYGLMQLNRSYFPSDLTPAENIQAGVAYLGKLLQRYETTEAALTAYNAGHDSGSRVYARTVLDAVERHGW